MRIKYDTKTKYFSEMYFCDLEYKEHFNNIMRHIVHFKNGMLNGECITFYREGVIHLHFYYKDDVMMKGDII